MNIPAVPTRLLSRLAAAVMAVALAASAACAQGASQGAAPEAGDVKPYSLDEILDLVKSKVPNKKVIAYARNDCIDFALDADVIAQLRRAGADDPLLAGLRGACLPKGATKPASTAMQPAATPPGGTPVLTSIPSGGASSAPLGALVPVRLRAAIVGGDFTVRPLPQVDFLLVGPRNDSIRVATNLDGVATATVPAGSYRVVSAAPVELGGKKYVWVVPVTVAAGMETIELTGKNASSDPSILKARPAATVAAAPLVAKPPAPLPTAASTPAPASSTAVTHAVDSSPALPMIAAATPSGWATALTGVPSSLAARARAGIVDVSGIHGRGSGFLVDSTGLVVTSAHLLEQDEDPAVQLDSVTRVRARIVSLDKQKGTALLRVNARRCAGCAALHLAAPGSSGRVFVIAAPAARGGVTSGALTRLDGKGIASDVRVSREQAGAPALTADGLVAGFTAVIGDSARLVPMAELTGPIAKFASAPLPGDTLLPLLPGELFPAAVGAEVRARAAFDVRDYTRQLDGFRLVMMSPQVAAWRQAQAEKEIADRRAKGDTVDRVDAIQAWDLWGDVAAARRPVVAVSVMPRASAKQSHGFGSALGAITGKINVGDIDLSDDGVIFPYLGTHDVGSFLDDARKVTILRDGEPLVPVETVRLPAVLNVADYQAKGKRYAWQVIQLYRADDFAPRAGGRAARFQILVKNADARGAPKLYELDRRMIAPLWRDLQAAVKG